MVDENTLRSGNWLMHKPGSFFQVNVKDFQKSQFWQSIKDICQPIPLTEQWFLKLGFTKTMDDEVFEKGPCVVMQKHDSSLYQFAVFNNDTQSLEHMNDISFVHELQNEYFEKTREELTLKATAQVNKFEPQVFADQIRQVFSSFFDNYDLRYNSIASQEETNLFLSGTKDGQKFYASFFVTELVIWNTEGSTIKELEKIREGFFNSLTT